MNLRASSFSNWVRLSLTKLVSSFTPAQARADELSRFLTSTRQFTPGGRVTAAAFMPPADLQLSVFRIDGLADVAIWQLGTVYVAKPLRKSLRGRGDLARPNVTEAGLSLLDDDNPPRHSAIIGWPTEKSKQKLHALQLANRARLVRHPAPTSIAE